MRKRIKNQKSEDSLDVFPAFTDLMSNAFMILSLFLLLALIESYRLNYNLAKANEDLRSATPIFIDEKSGNFKFTSGSAELTPQLKGHIANKIIPDIENILKRKEGAIDFIQVIGHTDGQENNRTSNLDQKLELVAYNKQPVTTLSPGSNADLGLMRALAVIQEIKKTKGFNNIKFRAYSAGQLYLSSGKLAPVNRKGDETRRRIEIRFIPFGEKQ